MGAKIMDGAAVARSLLADTKSRAAQYLNQSGRQPMLAAVLVGDDAGSRTYVAMKRRRCAQNGVSSIVVELPFATTALLRCLITGPDTGRVKHRDVLSCPPAGFRFPRDVIVSAAGEN